MGYPVRERKPRHPGHFRKPKPEKKMPLKLQQQAAEANPYKDGLTRIFLDDERHCPAGWTLAKDVPAFKALIDACPPDQLAAVSLDWYLGCGITSGEKAAEYLADHLSAKPDSFDNLEFITCHSSDRDKARGMAKTIVNVLEAHEALRWVSITLGLPVDTRNRNRTY